MPGNFKAGRWAVREVISRLKSKGKAVRQFNPNYDDSWGENNYSGADHIYIDGKRYSCPDIEIYKDHNFQDIVIRLEVKSFENYPDNLPFHANEPYFLIKEYSIKQYLSLQKREEIPCRIMFVLGKDYDIKGFFWETLDNMVYRMNHIEEMYKGKFDDRKSLYYFWKVSDFRTDF